MTLEEAKNVAFRLANLNSKSLSMEEIRQALVVLANFAEDITFSVKTFNKED